MILYYLFFGFLMAHASAESGPDNGTDYVKVLFANAQFEINRALSPLDETSTLGLPAEMQTWLNQSTEGDTRFHRLKLYLRTMELKFQDGPCSDGSGIPATICFFRDPAPFVMISLNMNRMTTQDQAVAMLIHEAGHLTGEKDHLFLDRTGVALWQAVKLPSLLSADASTTDIVPNIFEAKAGCDDGSSSQAQIVREALRQDLEKQCAARNLSCDLDRTEFLFQGSQGFQNGQGFDMKVTCAGKAVLRLRPALVP